MRIMKKVSALATGVLLLFVVAIVPARSASAAPNRAAGKQQRQQPKAAPHPAELSPLEWLLQMARRLVPFGQPSIPIPDVPSLSNLEPMSSPTLDPVQTP